MNLHPSTRIVGTEFEYGIIGADLSKLELDDLRRAKPPGLVMVKTFLSNGGRKYLDYNNQLEYSTPECASIADTVHAEIAGEQIVYETLVNLVKKRKIDPFHLHKRVIDDAGNTWGYHENYQVPRKHFHDYFSSASLLAHLATRAVFCGAGDWKPNDIDVARVVPAQKTQAVDTETDIETIRHKPLLNQRDEALDDSYRWGRLHITSGDANMSPWASAMQLGTTSLVLRLTENPWVPINGIASRNYVKLANRTALDDSLSVLHTMEDSKEVTALDIQEIILQAVEILSEHIELPKEEQIILMEWRKTVDSLRLSPSDLYSKVGWLTRSYVMHRIAEKNKITDVDHPKLNTADKTWDSLDPTKNTSFEILHGRATESDFYEPDRVEYFRLHPPSDTRAKKRGNLIKNLPKYQRRDTEVGWNRIKSPEEDYHLEDAVKCY